MDLPEVTCLCPTYGRVERLRDAVACFLLQDYPNKRLLIFNDAVARVGVPPDGACVVNTRPRFETLGHKRQRLLEAAQTPLVAHWDDDDLYLPWHLSRLVSKLLELVPARLKEIVDVQCAKPRAAWWAVGPREDFDVRGIRHNVFEGQMLFDRQAALDLGGYPPRDSGQAAALLARFKKAGRLYTWNPPDEWVSYVYRWGDGADHVSARKGRPTRDDDFGDGTPLIPEDADPTAWAKERLEPQFANLVIGAGDWKFVCAQPLAHNIESCLPPVNTPSKDPK